MKSGEFSAQYAILNPEQKEAVDTIEGPVMVVAGPGTGKTQILTLRIANILLNTQINPENILALTFSESASHQMRERLVKIIGTPAFRVEIATFHGFSNSIIQDFPEEFENLISAVSITEEEQLQYIEDLVDTLELKKLRPWGDNYFYVKDILSAINQLKKESVTPAKLKSVLKKQREDFKSIPDLYHDKGKYKGQMKGKYQEQIKDMDKLEEFISVFEGYQKKLLKEKTYDFSDMLIEVIKVLEKKNELLLLLQEKYQYILVDEHQDTNASQNRLVELLAGFYEVPNLFVVGDEKQSIYRFQGASLENFLYFQKRFPQAKLINLKQNYRSHQTILDASVSFISKNISANILTEEIKLIAANDIAPENIKVAQLDDYYGEFEYVAACVEKLINKGVNPEAIAVLGRRNFELTELTGFFKRKNISFVLDADTDILEDIWIKKFLFILEAINNFDQESFAKILNIDVLKLDPFEVFDFINFAKTEKKNLFEVLEDKEQIKFRKINDFYSFYKGWVTLSKNIPLDELFVKIFNEAGIKKGLLGLSDRNEILAKFISLFEGIKERIYRNSNYSLSEFLTRIKLAQKHNLPLKAKQDFSHSNSVRLFTVHKAKGLEFEYVFIIQCIVGRWGSLRKKGERIKIPWSLLGENIKSQAEFEAIEDERRLFFVGLTRAKKDVILTYSRFSEEQKEQLPSQFLEEIDTNLLTNLNTEKFNKKFAGKKDILFDEPISITSNSKEQEYLRRLFLEKGLNVSGFNNFLECPWKYFFVNLISLPDKREKYQLFGSAIHASIDELIKKRKEAKNPKKLLIDKFTEYIKKLRLSEKDYKEFLDKGKAALSGFYDNIFINFPDSIESEVTVRGIRLSDTLTINGRMDMVEKTEKGNLIVHDFKTGKAKSRRDIDGSKSDNKHNYLRQLVFYKILLDNYRDNIDIKKGSIDFVEPDEKGKFKSEVFEITEEQVNGLLPQLQSVANQIYSFSFWNESCGVKECEWCDLRKMMN